MLMPDILLADLNDILAHIFPLYEELHQLSLRAAPLNQPIEVDSEPLSFSTPSQLANAQDHNHHHTISDDVAQSSSDELVSDNYSSFISPDSVQGQLVREEPPITDTSGQQTQPFENDTFPANWNDYYRNNIYSHGTVTNKKLCSPNNSALIDQSYVEENTLSFGNEVDLQVTNNITATDDVYNHLYNADIEPGLGGINVEETSNEFGNPSISHMSFGHRQAQQSVDVVTYGAQPVVTPNALLVHVANMTAPAARHGCLHCIKSFTRPSDQDRHAKTHHPNVTWFNCPSLHCGKRFLRKDRMEDHKSRRRH